MELKLDYEEKLQQADKRFQQQSSEMDVKAEYTEQLFNQQVLTRRNTDATSKTQVFLKEDSF